jgi:hypothetical protein
VTVTVSPPVIVVLPSSIAVDVEGDGDSGGGIPAWVTSIGGFMAGAGAIGTVVAEAARRRRNREEQEPEEH